MTFAMVSDKAKRAFAAAVARGERPTLTRADFDPPPRGAFDQMPEELKSGALSSGVKKGLDALSRDSASTVRAWTSRRRSQLRRVLAAARCPTHRPVMPSVTTHWKT